MGERFQQPLLGLPILAMMDYETMVQFNQTSLQNVMDTI